MLEVWAGLYELIGEENFLTLAERYSHPSIFRKLANGDDPLSNCHANASIPWAHGAAKMYEGTKDEKWLHLVKSFWKCAVTDREAFCTGGQNSGEFWIPPNQLGMFMGERTQEFCTVYNMVRLLTSMTTVVCPDGLSNWMSRQTSRKDLPCHSAFRHGYRVIQL